MNCFHLLIWLNATLNNVEFHKSYSWCESNQKNSPRGKLELEAAPRLGNSFNCIPKGTASKNRYCLLSPLCIEVVFPLPSVPDWRFPCASLPPSSTFDLLMDCVCFLWKKMKNSGFFKILKTLNYYWVSFLGPILSGSDNECSSQTHNSLHVRKAFASQTLGPKRL